MFSALAFISSSMCQGQSQELLDVLCYGCSEQCDGCDYGKTIIMPECVSLSEARIAHVWSSGGRTTLEDLEVEKGYWRATNKSKDILECYNDDACRGGITGATEYCSEGYQGACELARRKCLIWCDRLL